MIHEIEVQVARTMGPITWYRAVCSCGSRSPQHGTVAHVELWARRHVEFHGEQDRSTDE